MEFFSFAEKMLYERPIFIAALMGKMKLRIRPCVKNCKSPKLTMVISTWKVNSNMTVMNGGGTQIGILQNILTGMIIKSFRSFYKETLI